MMGSNDQMVKDELVQKNSLYLGLEKVDLDVADDCMKTWSGDVDSESGKAMALRRRSRKQVLSIFSSRAGH